MFKSTLRYSEKHEICMQHVFPGFTNEKKKHNIDSVDINAYYLMIANI